MWWSRLWRRDKLERDLGRELQFHIAERISFLKGTGLSEDEARRRVRLEFGGIEQVKEECRDARGISLFETTFQDLRYAFRGMRRSPLFTLVALAALALTTGTVSTVLPELAEALLGSTSVGPWILLRDGGRGGRGNDQGLYREPKMG